MAKRFIDTAIFEDEWFMGLSVDAKIFWIYLITNCDHAGIFRPNKRLFFFQTGIKELPNSYETLTKELGNRLTPITNDYVFIPKFIKYQYPKGLNRNVKAQESVINILTQYKLLPNSLITVQDKDTFKDKDTEQGYRYNGETSKKLKEL